MAPFLWMNFNCLKAEPTSRGQFNFTTKTLESSTRFFQLHIWSFIFNVGTNVVIKTGNDHKTSQTTTNHQQTTTNCHKPPQTTSKRPQISSKQPQTTSKWPQTTSKQPRTTKQNFSEFQIICFFRKLETRWNWQM